MPANLAVKGWSRRQAVRYSPISGSYLCCSPLFAHFLWCIKHSSDPVCPMLHGIFTGTQLWPANTSSPSNLYCAAFILFFVCFVFFLNDLTSGIVIVCVTRTWLYSGSRGSYHISSSKLYLLLWWKLRGSWEVKPWRAELVEADLIGFHWLN